MTTFTENWKDYRILSHYFGVDMNNTNKALIGIDLLVVIHLIAHIFYQNLITLYNVIKQKAVNRGHLNLRVLHLVAHNIQILKQPQCWLKSTVPGENKNICVISGTALNNDEQISPDN